MLYVNCVVVGKSLGVPGIHRVTLLDASVVQIRKYFQDKVTNTLRGVDLYTADSTVYEVQFDELNFNFNNPKELNNRVINALQGISELTVWAKARDVVHNATQRMRQVGISDTKFVWFEDERKIWRATWSNSNLSMDNEAYRVFTSFLGNFRVQNGPESSPVLGPLRRILGSMDLLNLGFYTEAFITSFALLDDLTQEVVQLAMVERGLSGDEIQKLTRDAIKDKRLEIYLSVVMKLCGWKSLQEDNNTLFQEFIVANRLRNDIMHGDGRMEYLKAEASMETVIAVMGWLRANPFGFSIDVFPPLNKIDLDFRIL